MNRPTKITLTLLGIAASVGIASVLCLGLGSLIASSCRHEPEEDPLATWCPPRRVDTVATPAPISVCPTPAPKKPLQEGYERVKCEQCGQEYDVSRLCDEPPTKEQIKHRHLTPKEKAEKIKAFHQLKQRPKDPRVPQRDIDRVMEHFRKDWGLSKADVAGSEKTP